MTDTYPKEATCDKCGEKIFVRWSKQKEKEYATDNYTGLPNFHPCYPLSYSPLSKPSTPEPTSEEDKGVTNSPFALPKTATIRVARSKNYQTVEVTFDVEEVDVITAMRETYRALGFLLEEEKA